MNEEIRNNELSEDELEHVSGGTGFGILPGFSTTVREQQNEKNAMELDIDEMESADRRVGVKVAINQFGLIKRLGGQN